MKLKKIVALLLIVCLGTVSILTGCSKENDDEKGKKETTGSVEEGVTSNFNETGYPIVNEPITLSVMFCSHGDTKELNEIPFIQELEKKTNIKLDVETIRTEYGTKLNLAFASGDLPDILLYGENMSDATVLSNKVSFVPLNDYIDKYAPNIQKMFDEVPSTKKIATAPDGSIYGLPSVRPFRPQVNNAWGINTTWLKNVGLEMPTTTEEFYTVLKAFKENDANGNGDPNDEIPLSSASNGMFSWKDLLNAYGMTSTANFENEKMQVRDDQVQFTPIMDEYKEAVKYMRRLMSEELVNPEMYTGDWWTIASSDSNGGAKIGVTPCWTINQHVGQWVDQYEILPPLEGPNGHVGVTNESTQTKLVKNTFAITAKNEYPEATMRWVNEWYSEDMSVQAFFGSFGEGTQKNDDGTYSILEPSDSSKNPDQWKWINAPADRSPIYYSADLESRTKDADYHKIKQNYDLIYGPYIEPESNTFPMLVWEPNETKELSTIKSDIYGYVDRKTAEWITEGGSDEEWDEYKEEINKMGYDKLMKIYQGAYDRYNGK